MIPIVFCASVIHLTLLARPAGQVASFPPCFHSRGRAVVLALGALKHGQTRPPQLGQDEAKEVTGEKEDPREAKADRPQAGCGAREEELQEVFGACSRVDMKLKLKLKLKLSGW
jgi:hypothetical protein